jgi:hypothetical protein
MFSAKQYENPSIGIKVNVITGNIEVKYSPVF